MPFTLPQIISIFASLEKNMVQMSNQNSFFLYLLKVNFPLFLLKVNFPKCQVTAIPQLRKAWVKTPEDILKEVAKT